MTPATPPEPVTALLRDAKEAIVFLLQSAPTQGNRLSPDWLSALVNRIDAALARAADGRKAS